MSKKKPDPPRRYAAFKKAHPDIVRAYEALGGACHQAGPLDEKTRELVKLGIALGAGLESASRAHVRLARAAGLTRAEIQHAVLLSATTIGFPSMMKGLTWVGEELARKG